MLGLGDKARARDSLRATLAFMVSHDVPFDLLVRMEHYAPANERGSKLARHIAEFLLLFSPMLQRERRETLSAVAVGCDSDVQRLAFLDLLRKGSSDQAEFYAVKT
jgi:hypothetical protein